MQGILFFDTETTGLPDWKTPSGGENQPHLVQLSCVCADIKTRRIYTTLDVIIKPDGWEISEEMTKIHGISHGYAEKVGVPEKMAVEMLLAIWSGKRRVCHNRTFDQRIIRIALKRYFGEEDQEAWADKDDFYCTMLKSKPVMKLPPKKKFGYKNPSLSEAYKYFTGEKIIGAHNSLNDTIACMRIFWALQDLENDKD